MLDLLRLGPFFRAHTFPVAFPVGFAPCATDSVFFPPLYFWLFLCILGVFFSDFCRLGFWVSLLVFGFVCCVLVLLGLVWVFNGGFYCILGFGFLVSFAWVGLVLRHLFLVYSVCTMNTLLFIKSALTYQKKNVLF